MTNMNRRERKFYNQVDAFQKISELFNKYNVSYCDKEFLWLSRYLNTVTYSRKNAIIMKRIIMILDYASTEENFESLTVPSWRGRG